MLLLKTNNNDIDWYLHNHAGIFGEVTSTPYSCNSKFQSEVWGNWNLVFQLTLAKPVLTDSGDITSSQTSSVRKLAIHEN